jgi:glycyl-tRNA synthetase
MKENQQESKMEKIISLAKRRGFIFQGSEIYGGLAGTWDYGPLGVELKNNIKNLWWKMFVQDREDIFGLDAAILMNQNVWKASGHVDTFSDPLVECKKCKRRFRADQLEDKKVCPECGGELGEPRQFNMMFQNTCGCNRR